MKRKTILLLIVIAVLAIAGITAAGYNNVQETTWGVLKAQSSV
jgi:Tfp pilus assembly protein PilV